ncbi:MAG: hypothetical protein HY046_07565 [Acidobacteria bacterium]|nr:hypothetical protein [Acidobacteriota bacterium]
MTDAANPADARRSLLEKLLRGSTEKNTTSSSGIQRRAPGSPVPLTAAQEQIWLRSQTPGIPLLFNESVTLHRNGPLDAGIIERCLAEIIRRHEIWRTTFESVDGQPVQVVHTDLPAPLRVLDLRTSSDAEKNVEEQKQLQMEIRRPFDLRKGSLVRPVLVKLSDDAHRLYMIVHQIVFDGVSAYQVLLTELAALYEAYSEGKLSPLPELQIQYADFAIWQRQSLASDEGKRQAAFWQENLAGEIPVLNLHTDKRRPPVQTFRGAILPFRMPKRLSEAAKALAQQEGVSFFTLQVTVFAALLHSYTQQEDFVIGTPSPTGRERPETQGLLGYFLNPVALRFRISGNSAFRELISEAREVIAGAISSDDVPLEWIASKIKLKLDPSRNPFFQVATSLEPALTGAVTGWDLTPMDLDPGGARWDIYFVLDDRPDGFLGRVQYNPDLFENGTMGMLVADFQALLERVVQDPGQRLSKLPRFTTLEPQASSSRP